MIDRFTVKNFKSLVDVGVDLGVVNVFIGANGSGKSNLLEALGILGAAASGRVNDESLQYRGVRLGSPALYKSSFKNKRSVQDVSFEATGYGASYSVSLRNSTEETNTYWEYQRELLKVGSNRPVDRRPATSLKLNSNAGLAALRAVEMPADSPAGMLLELSQNYAIYSPDTPTLRGLDPDPQSRDPVGLAGGRLPEGLAMLRLGQYADEWNHIREMISHSGWISTIGVSFAPPPPHADSVPQDWRSIKFTDRYMSLTRNMLSRYDVNEGVLYLLYYAVLALHPNAPGLFALDNFDQALNPRTAREFTRTFCYWLLEQQDRQVLLTTHNPLVLDGLPLQDDRVRLFTVDRSKLGRTVVNRVTVSDRLLRSAEKGVPLSQQWVMGNFGGVPSSV